MTRDIKESEQSKEAEIVRLPTPSRTICIDWMTGQICAPEPNRARRPRHSIHRAARRLAREKQIAMWSLRTPIFTASTNCGPLAVPRWAAAATMRGRMDHEF